MRPRHLHLILALLLPFGTLRADWLVVDSGTPAFARYQLLPERARVTLATGEHLELLDDSGQSARVEGPGEFDLASLRRDAGAGAVDGLAGRLATLLATPDRVQRPGTSRSGGAQPTHAVAPGAFDIEGAAVRCVDRLAGLRLARGANRKGATARVELALPGGGAQRLTWYAGFDTVELPALPADIVPGARIGVGVQPSLGRALRLELHYVPATLPRARRLDLMVTAGCRTEVDALLGALPSR